MKRLLFVTGIAAAVLGLTGVGAAGAADGSAHQAAAGTPGKRVGEVIQCHEVSHELPTVFGRSCDSTAWGPLSDFTLIDRASGQA
ncbi:hypothetical protein, partial [Kitasatospora sp. NPDC001175]